MVAVAKNEPYVGFTLKALVATMILEAATLGQIVKAAEKNFPRKFGKPAQNKKMPKLVSRLLRQLHRGKLSYDKIETVHVPAPAEAIKIKDVEFKLPKAYLKSKAKPAKTEKVKEEKTPKKTKGKTSGRVSVTDEGDVEVVD